MKKERDLIYFAGLLHQIGKMFQLADDNQLVEENKRSRSVQFEMQDEMWYTAKFIRDHETQFRLIFGDDYSSLLDLFLTQLAGPMGYIIDTAHYYACGGTSCNTSEGWKSIKSKRLSSVFDSILVDNPTYEYKFKAKTQTLNFNRDYFPDCDNIPYVKETYQSLWNGFVTEFKCIQSTNVAVFADTLLSLLDKYTSTVSSRVVLMPDVSMFEHSKSAAAFALTLYDYLKTIGRNRVEEGNTPFLLIGGDFSGIQEFIYDIVSKNAAKNLKGRSFYLQLLVENILQRLLSELNLYQSNIIYASGGGFYVIAANTEFTKQKINNFYTGVSEKIFKYHHNSLFLAMDSIEIKHEDLVEQKIDLVWKNLSEKLNEKKRRRYAEKLKTEEGYKFFFEPSEGKGLRRDIVTNEEIQENEDIHYLDSDNQKPLRKSTYQQILLGKSIKDSDCWISSTENLDFLNSQLFSTCDLGINNYFVSLSSLESKREKLRLLGGNIKVTLINNLKFFEASGSVINNRYGYFYYGGNHFPVDQSGSPLTFEDLTGNGPMNKLGVLRMDVDNLGSLFKRGFEGKIKTLSRYSSLSKALVYFFSGHLNEIWESNENYKKHLIILYSGGDDLFVIGRWDLTISFAEEINDHFHKWTCQNKNLTLSGGIAIVPAKFPISKAAEMAELAEKKAKSHVLGTKEKNSFCIFGYPLNWENEFPLVHLLCDKLTKMVSEKKALPSGFLHRVMGLNEMAMEARRRDKVERWRWMSAYYFARLKDTLKDNEAISFISDLQKGIFTDQCSFTAMYDNPKSQYTFLNLLAIAARWAELSTRNYHPLN